MEFIKWGQKQVRQFALNLTETEIRVEEATNNDPWGPHGGDMAKIAEEALDPEKYREIMTVIARRLTESGDSWRHIYKALLLLEHLVRHGPAKVARDTQANSSILLELQSFEYKDKNGRDQGINVRNRSKELLALVSDPARLAEAREVARQNRNKYHGTSKGDARYESSSPPPAAAFNQSLPKRVVYEEKGKEEAKEEDPFEATRKRIEKLKATEQEKTSTIRVNLPQQQKKEPKKLSQVKVNPEIAAAFLKPQNTVTVAKPPDQTKETAAPEDLLGDLMQDVASAAPAESVIPLEDVKNDTDDLFDPFAAPTMVSPASAAPPVAQRVESDDWADFSEAQSKHVPAEIPLNDLLAENAGVNVPVALTGMPAQPVPSAPVKADPFASLCPTGQKPVQVPMGTKKATSTFSTAQPPLVQQSVPQNGLAMNAPTPWTTQKMPQQSGMQPGIEFHLNGLGQTTVASMAALRPQGVPMNPSAMPPQRAAVRKEDPFANLGF